MHPQPRGSLDVVGTGINGANQATFEAVACIEAADVLFYSVTHPVTEYWLRLLRPDAVSFSGLYGESKDRSVTYAQMVEALVSAVRRGSRVCAVFYGHPGVLVYASHEAIRLLRSEGYHARMFAAVSADGCLYADLLVNPGDAGMQMFEATDFLLSARRFDPTSGLLLWQIGVLGERTARRGWCRRERLQRLVDELAQHYPLDHEVVLYLAATFPGDPPIIHRLPLKSVSDSEVEPLAMLYVPPLPSRPPAADILRWLQED